MWLVPPPTGQSVSNAYGIGSRSKCHEMAANATAIDIFLRQIDEVLLVEATFQLRARV